MTISVRQQSADNRYGGVYIFKFDAQRRLRSVGHAGNASIDENHRWRLDNYVETSIGDERVSPSKALEAEFQTRLSPEFLGLAVLAGVAAGPRAVQLHSAFERERFGRAQL